MSSRSKETGFRCAARFVAVRAVFTLTVFSLTSAGCGKKDEANKDEAKKPATTPDTQKPTAVQPDKPDVKKLQEQARGIFQSLPVRADKPETTPSQALIDLGRMLYYEKRLSKNHDLSCNSCHELENYGIDTRGDEGKRQTSQGHKAQVGDRNSPTVYNAALHFAQFWDAREPDVEAQAKGPVTNPVEMAMADGKSAGEVLATIPGYVEAFKAAFPDADPAITFDNIAVAIGAFERGLLTPGRLDKFMGGDDKALTDKEIKGLDTFLKAGCTTCHMGPAVGGTMLQKLGLIKPYETEDTGRFKVTNNEAEKYFFKVPSLRNIAKTGPYMHDGSIDTLDKMVRIMNEYQLATGKFTDEQVSDVVAFLNALTGELPKDYIAEPKLPESGPKTPKPDPS